MLLVVVGDDVSTQDHQIHVLLYARVSVSVNLSVDVGVKDINGLLLV
jgi:hypothetical protein